MFDEFASLLDDDDDFIDQNDPSDNEYNNFEDLAVLTKLSNTSVSNAIIPTKSVQAAVPINQTQQLTHIQCRTPTTPLPEVPVTVKVKNHPVIFGNRTPMAFKSAADPAHPTQQNYFGRMDIQCMECGAWHWLVERVNQLHSTTTSRLIHVFKSCCKKGLVKLDVF